MFKKTAVLALAVLVIAAAILAGAWLVFRPGVQPVAANKLPPRPPAAAPAAPAAPASAALRAQPPQADPAAGGTKAEMRFTRYFTDTSKEQPQACLQFSEPLVESGAINYQDYLRFSPPAKVALNVAKDRLCIGGLGFGRDYKVTIAAGLPAQSGDKTAEDETQTVGFGDRPALVAFAGNGFILPRQGSNGLALETINVSKVKLAVTRIGDRNLARSAFGRNSKGEPYYYNPDSSVAAPVWTGEMPIASVHNERVTTIIPLVDVIKTRRPGAYIVTAKKFAESGSGDDDDDRSGVAVQWVVDTDLALTAMRGADGLHVFVRSLDTAKPVAKVNLALIAENNDQLGTAETDADGHAAFAAGLTRGAGPLRPKMVMAYGAEDDFAALDLSRAGFDLTDRGVGGREAPGPVDAFVYTDRGVYRPGETVQLVALLRDSLGTAVADTPVTAIVLRPDGVEAKRVQLDAAPAGGFHLPYGLSATAARGLWSARISVDGGKHTVGSAVFDVEDFVPQRLKVAVTASATFLKPGAATPLAIDSRYLYGAPAAGLAAEGELKLKVDPSPYPAAKGYRFGLVDDKFKPEIRPLEIGKTDDAGKTALALDVAPLPKTTQPLAAEIDVGVVEPGGRVTPSTITLPIRNLTLAIGIRPRFTGDRVQENAAAAFDVIALDEAGTPVARQGLDYSFIHEVTSYDWYYTDDRAWHYQRIVHDRPIADGKLDVAADKPAELNHAFDWGSYRLEVRDRTSGAATSIRFWAGWGATVERDTPDTVQVTANRDRAKPGEPVTITIHPPFAGEVQIAVATDSVLETRTLFVPAEGTSIEVTASEQWGAGAYVLATLYRPQSAVKVHEPVRAIGLTWVPLDQLAHTLGVALGAPNLARPRGTLDVPVKISGAAKAEPVYVTLAAVDEGILQLTDFISPDPNEYYFGKRRLGVDIRDDYARLLQNGGGQVGVLRQGGDSGGGAGLSVVPTETVALFSGVLAVGADGTVHVPLQIPSFNGEIRLMAVAYGAHALGRAEAHVTVRDPVVAELILPRFLAPGDAASATLQLHNVEGAAGTYHAAVEASGAVGSGTFSADYDLPSGAEITAAVPLAAGDPGIGHFQLSVNGPGGFSVTRTWNLEVRTPRFPITLADTALQAPGTAYRFDPRLLDAFLPGTASVSIGYAGFKGIDVPGLLQSLDRYPYGCSEQTTSRALPLLVFNDLSLLAGVKTDQEIRGRVQQAIDTLLERQDAEGSFGLWRSGDGAARPWLGAYITDFLVRAKEHGYVVPDTALDAAYRSMAQVTQGQGNYDYGTYYRSEYRQLVKLDGAAYAYYVLARANRADIGELRYFHDNQFGRIKSPLAEAQVGAALAIAGDRSRAAHAFQVAKSAKGDFVWDYYGTPLRDTAATIVLAAETQQKALLPDLVQRLETLDARVTYTQTQEKSWMLLAAKAVTDASGPLNIAVNDHAPASLKQPAAFHPDGADIAQGYTLTNRGQGDAWRTVVVHGVPKLPTSAMSAGLAIAKTITTLDGKPVDLANLHQNDRLMVVLSGEAPDKAEHHAILVDMLPAGFEIEAVVTRGKDGGAEGYDWIGPLGRTRSREARDDRFVAALDLENFHGYYTYDDTPDTGETFRLAYIVRAVTPGSFALPGATIEDMYRPGVMARTGEGVIVVSAKAVSP